MKKTNLLQCVAAATMCLSAVAGGYAGFQFTEPINIQAMAKDVTESNSPGGQANFGRGSASITIHPNNLQSLKGKKFNVYKLFDAENAEGMESINYTWNQQYKSALQTVVGKRIKKDASKVTEYEVVDYIQTLNNHKIEGADAEQTLEGRYSDFRYFVEELRTEIENQNLGSWVVNVTDTTDSGDLIINGLDYGYYIVDEVTATEDTHSAASLCMVNTANPNAEVNIKSDYPSIIKKINEDDLQVGWNDIADYEIGQTVPYYYETNVPNMNGYHSYYFAFHDKMDRALTFNPDSLQITIQDLNKVYTVKDTDYNVVMGEGEDTFRIEFVNLKALIDREFPEGMNNDNENKYGQYIKLTYNATLNDNAAEDTGRPGFENNVRLEFSNDPDGNGDGETGTTPWDTVVCFTYKINGTKVNNHNKLLKGAKFRLYSDANCTEEVFVKETQNGYNVINRDSLGGNDHTGGNRPSEAVEMVSDKDGVFTIYGLDQGAYWLKETDSPAGYRELLDPIEITITPTFTDQRNTYVAGQGATDAILQDLTATAHVKEFLSGAWNEDDKELSTDIEDGAVNITVVNTVGEKLPITGSSLTALMFTTGALLMGGYVFYTKRKNKADKAE